MQIEGYKPLATPLDRELLTQNICETIFSHIIIDAYTQIAEYSAVKLKVRHQ